MKFFIPNQAAFAALVVAEVPEEVEVVEVVEVVATAATLPYRSTGYRRPRRRHHVRGYRRKNGSYVSAHSRKG